jgi:hypothetical protein
MAQDDTLESFLKVERQIENTSPHADVGTA